MDLFVSRDVEADVLLMEIVVIHGVRYFRLIHSQSRGRSALDFHVDQDSRTSLQIISRIDVNHST